jgi:hypothetical protein
MFFPFTRPPRAYRYADAAIDVPPIPLAQGSWNISPIPVVLDKQQGVSSSCHLHPDSDGRLSMKRKIALGLLVAAALSAAPVAPHSGKSEVAKMTLKVGDTAPDFTLLSDQWKTVKLSDYRGKKNVFLAVYVLAFTGG